MPPLKINNLTKRYGDFVAVNDLSFSIKPGEIFGLLGPNGAGKTTTISCITTLEEPTQGSIEIFGKNNIDHPNLAKSKFGCVPQELIHHSYFSVKQILKFHSLYYGVRHANSHIEYLLHKLDLFEHRNKLVSHLSGGMKRRLLIAKALVHKPKLILLDEPTAGVDVELRHSLWDLILTLKNDGASILLTTHYLEEAEKLCDRIGIIQNGSLIKLASTKELIDSMGIRIISVMLSAPLASINHPYLHSQTNALLIFHAPQNFTLSTLLSDLQLCNSAFSDISIQEGQLENIFTSILNSKGSK
ncbi:MAG: ABC transporter ATP-binding protein [Rhabdochlamydiaceae bacterium]|nr:ABC transporter ATP-binding protein [Candidatus Amphrikana amoebophyrae]